MKKRMFSLILALALLCTLLPQVVLPASAEVYSGSCGDNLTWSLDTATGLLTISGSGAMTNFPRQTKAPWSSYAADITAAALPEGLTNLGDYAFSGCAGITGISIPAGLNRIGDFAFEDCTGLTGITVPYGVTSIGSGAFSFCTGLTELTLPESLTELNNAAFQYCSGLVSLVLPDSLTCINSFTFLECDGLTDIRFPQNLTKIDYLAFAGCSGLRSLVLPDTVTEIGSSAFTGCKGLTSVTFPASLMRIESEAFSECTGLTKLSFPEHLEYIGDAAFRYCSGLTEIKLPNNLTGIYASAFDECPKLRSVWIPASASDIRYHAFGYIRENEESWEETPLEGFTIYGYPGTAAETYATENGFRFVAADRFTDVNGSDYFFNPVMWAVAQEPPITSGVDETHFGPNNDCTREQIVTFLWAVYGKPAPAGTGSSFSDVGADAWYYQPVMWAVENGYTSGLPDGSFGVGQPCTRAQAMTFLWAAQGRPEPASMASSFSDVSGSDWFCKAILWAAENGITKGIGDGLFGVNNTCTRAQIITFLYKAYN